MKYLVFLLGLFLLPCSVSQGAMALWGVDEDDGEIFSIGDINNIPGTFNSFGVLTYNGVPLTSLGGGGTSHIESFTVAPGTSTAYMVRNNFNLSPQSTASAPILLRYDLNNVASSNFNVEIVGTVTGLPGSGEITGLSFDPQNPSNLYGLFQRTSGNGRDNLLTINTSTGASTNLGDLRQNGGGGTTILLGEDLAFRANGDLFVADDDDENLVRVNNNGSGNPNPSSLTVVDNNMNGGITGDVRIEALAFDPTDPTATSVIAFDDEGNRFVRITLANGGNTVLASVGALGLTDVEGLSYGPVITITPIPEPSSMLLLSMVAVFGGYQIRKKKLKQAAE